MDLINTGVVGFGKLGLLHAGIMNVLPGCRLAAVADQSSSMLRFLRSKLAQVATFDNHQDMLAAGGLGAVVISTPSNTHAQIALDFVQAGVPVLIEKPLSATLDQARPLLEHLKQNPVPNLVGYMTRHQDTYVRAQHLLKEGALGKLQTFSAHMYIGQLFRQGKGWRYDKDISGGGVLITQNSHLVDMLLWLFGELDWVSAHTRRLYSKQVEDSAHVYFRFKSGLTGYLDSSWSKRHYRTITMSIQVQGEAGTLEVDDDQVKIFLDQAHGDLTPGWSIWRKPDLYEGVSFDIGGPYYTRQAEEFLAAVREGSKVTSDVFSAFATQCALEAIYRSAGQDGVPVSLEEVS
ncbi:MAG: Gfo/Idh/MocA family oxidoreductase [Desulfarculaceae bacterium]|jgi:predicted dehydrogenase